MRYVNSGTPGFEYRYEECGISEIDEKTLLTTAEKLVDELGTLFEEK